MSPKDLAVTVWSLARLNYPASNTDKDRIRQAIKTVMKKIYEEPFLFENENDPKEFSMINSDFDDREIESEKPSEKEKENLSETEEQTTEDAAANTE